MSTTLAADLISELKEHVLSVPNPVDYSQSLIPLEDLWEEYYLNQPEDTVLDYLNNLLLRLGGSKYFNRVKIEFNDNIANDIVDKTGSCISGPLGKYKFASLLYLLDDNIDLLSLNTYKIEKGNESFIDTIGKAILVKTTDREKHRPVLLIDGVITGPAVGKIHSEFDWKKAYWYAILKAALGKYETVILNTEDTVSQKPVTAFIEYVAERLGKKDSVGIKDCQNFGLKETEMDKEINGFKYTHWLEKPSMNEEAIRRISLDSYNGEQYLDAFFLWNQYIRETYTSWPENLKLEHTYAKEKFEGHTASFWNQGRGFVRGIEVNVPQELERLERELYQSMV